ncbi:MAG TPA: hypothetical protein VER04_08680 [Polyangiaceae bacterium]|nr:hypothetical protein [Polyangiaceae bacterium]
MRLLFVPLCLLVAGSVRVCSNEEKSNAQVAASAEALSAPVASAGLRAVLPRARIGGSVAGAGDLSVEVALHEGGLIEALVSDVKGLPINEGVKLSALVQAAGGASEKVELAYVPARARFEGHGKAGVELAPGPVAISVEVGGKVQSCKLAVGVVVPRPKVGGHVLAAGDFSAEILAHRGGEVQAFVRDSAGAEVKANASASFLVRCRAKGGGTEEVVLRFDAPHSCFAGKAKAGVELEPGPLEFVVDAKVGAGIGGLERIALTVDASHGGQLVTVGDYSLELVAKGGELKAFAFDASGKVQTAGDLDVKLDVGAGSASKLALAWDAPCLCYKANLAGNLNLALQPIRVSLVAGGKAFFGAVASLQAAAKANLNIDTKLDATANVDANAKPAAQASAKLDPKLDAKASASAAKGASATVKVTPPKVSVTSNSGATSGAKAGGGAKASAGFSFGTK